MMPRIPVFVLLRRAGLGDLLLSFYGAVCVRQYFWGVGSEALAWALTTAVTLVIWLAYLAHKPAETEKISGWFYGIVGGPLLALWALRAGYPDFSWDVRSYHLFLGERGLDGPLFLPDDFFPGHHHFNPAPDMLTGLARRALGYRLGTILNFFVLLWCGQILYRLAADYIRHKGLLCVGVLAVLLCEQLAFQINTYMIDLLPLPLMLEATRLMLRSDPPARSRSEILLFSVLLGMAVAMKLTIVILAVPLAVAYLLRKTVGHWKWADGWLLLLALFAFAAPLLPYSIYMAAYAGNPVLPFANHFFQSPYASTAKETFDARFGPQTFLQTLFWPLLGHFEPARLGEAAAYSGRILLGNVAAIGALFFWRQEKRLKILALVVLGGSLLWSAMLMGYVRYAGYLELIGGLVLLEFCVLGLQRFRAARLCGALAILLLALWTVQIGLGFRLVEKFDLGMRYSFGSAGTLLRESRAHWEAAQRIGRDRNLAAFLTRRDRLELERADAWIVSDPLTFGVQVLLKNNIPALGVWRPFFSEVGREKFHERIDRYRDRRVYSLCRNDVLAESLARITEAGLRVGTVRELLLPFYLRGREVPLALIEILPRDAIPKPGPMFEIPSQPLPATAFRAQLSVDEPPTTFPPGVRRIITVRVANAGDATWPARGDDRGRYQVRLIANWRPVKASPKTPGEASAAFLYDVPPGLGVEVPLILRTPREPGEYWLALDLLQEQVGCFEDHGSSPFRLKVRVGGG